MWNSMRPDVPRKLPSIPVPTANEHNRHEFISAWMFNYGGTASNAYSVWEVEKRKNENRL